MNKACAHILANPKQDYAKMRSLVMTLVALAISLWQDSSAVDVSDTTSFMDFSVLDLHGRPVSMREFRAFRVLLVVNVASECGYTDTNYRELQVQCNDCSICTRLRGLEHVRTDGCVLFWCNECRNCKRNTTMKGSPCWPSRAISLEDRNLVQLTRSCR